MNTMDVNLKFHLYKCILLEECFHDINEIRPHLYIYIYFLYNLKQIVL